MAWNLWRSAIIVWLILFCIFWVAVPEALARTVVVVYDDSGSMQKPPDKWWYANYSLQTLTALLAPSDTLSVVFMSNPTKAIPWPDKKSALRTLHEQALPGSETPFQALETAMRAMEQSREEDRWLIVITDGGFQNIPSEPELRERINRFTSASGAKTVFLFIGAEVSDNLAVYWDQLATAKIFRAVGSRDIALRMNEIAALVNARVVDPDRLQVSSQKNHLTLTTELPLKRLTIFQQEDRLNTVATVQQAEVGTVPLEVSRLVGQMPRKAQAVRYAGISHITQKQANQVIPEGNLTITLDRPVALAQLKFFPEVAARFEISLEKEDGGLLPATGQNDYRVCTNKKIRVVARLLDPYSQQPLSATIKHPEKISAIVHYHQKDYPMVLEPQKRFFTVLMPVFLGKEPISATASFPGYFHFKSKVFILEGIECFRKLALEPVAPWSAKVTEVDQAPPLHLIPTVDGQPVAPEEFKAWTLKVLQAPPVGLQIDKQADHWLIRPQGCRWSACLTATGVMPLEVEISSTHPGETGRESLEFTISNVSWWTKCGWLVMLLLATLLFLWWLIGIIRKPRFCKGSAIIHRRESRTQQGRPYTYELPGSFWQRYLIPYRAERRVVESILFKAGKKCSFIWVAKESLTPEMDIDGQMVVDPAKQSQPVGDQRLNHNAVLAVQYSQRREFYQYSASHY